MSLDEDLREPQRRVINDLLKARFDQRKCPVCDATDWRAETVFALASCDKGHTQTDGKAQVVVPVRCAGCGYTMLFDAASVGVDLEKART